MKSATPTAMPPWWGDNPSLLLTVAHWAIDVGELNRPNDVMDFFEHPYNYSRYFKAWCESPVLSTS